MSKWITHYNQKNNIKEHRVFVLPEMCRNANKLKINTKFQKNKKLNNPRDSQFWYELVKIVRLIWVSIKIPQSHCTNWNPRCGGPDLRSQIGAHLNISHLFCINDKPLSTVLQRMWLSNLVGMLGFSSVSVYKATDIDSSQHRFCCKIAPTDPCHRPVSAKSLSVV